MTGSEARKAASQEDTDMPRTVDADGGHGGICAF